MILTGPGARLVVGDGGEGTLTVAGSLFAEPGTVTIGANGGVGTATFEPSAVVAASLDAVSIGGDGSGPGAPGTGHAVFNGATIQSEVRVGIEGTGTATWLASSTLTKQLLIGLQGGTGEGWVVGGLDVEGTTTVGAGSTGTLHVDGAGASFTTPSLHVGVGSTGAVLAHDSASLSVGSLNLGSYAGGSGTLELSSGAHANVTTGGVYAPSTSMASAAIVIRDPCTTLDCTYGLAVGHGPTTVTVRDGGLLTVASVSPFPSSVATFDIRESGRLSCNAVFRLAWLSDSHVYHHVLSVGPRGTLIRLLDAATLVDQAPIVDADLVHGFPPILVSEPTRLSALVVDHVDAFGPVQLELWEGMDQRVAVPALVDGVSYDVTRQSTWTFGDPPLVTADPDGWLHANTAGFVVGTIAFGSASRVVPIVVHPRSAMPFRSVNETANGTDGDGGSFTPTGTGLSADGRFVLFRTASKNLAPADTSPDFDVYMKDMLTGAIELMSADLAGASAPVDAFAESMSSDARFVCLSTAADLAPNSAPGATANVFLRDRALGTIETIDVDVDGGPSTGGSNVAFVSLDGRFIAFQSKATDLLAGVPPHYSNVYLRDRLAQVTTRIDPPIALSWYYGVDVLGMTPDARYVLYAYTEGPSTNLWRRDVTTGLDVLALPRTEGNVYISKALLADDGHNVAIHATGSGTLGGIDLTDIDVIVLYDIDSGEIAPVNIDPIGGWIADASSPWVAPDAHYVTFKARSAQLPRFDAEAWHLYRRDMASGAIDVVDCLGPNVPSGASSGPVALSADGSRALFHNAGPSFAANDTNAAYDLFVRTFSSQSADLDGDGTVGANDVAILLGAWGTQSADLDGDGTTGASDLTLLLGAWSG